MASPFLRFRDSMTTDNLWIYILTLLKEENLYAYEIRDKVSKRFSFSPGNMTAYIVLKKLQSGGFVRKASSSKDGGPERTYYAVTPKGNEELKKAADFYKSMTVHFK